ENSMSRVLLYDAMKTLNPESRPNKPRKPNLPSLPNRQNQADPCRFNCWAALIVLAGLLSQQLPAFAQGTAFTYQGRLTDSAGPANGIYDFTFQLFDAATAGSSQGGPLTNSSVAATQGLFTVVVDFGPAPFAAGAPRWLEISARTNNGGVFTILSPRQPLTATPYSMFAANAASAASVTGPVSASQLSGTI